MKNLKLPLVIIVILVVGYLVLTAKQADNQNGITVQPPPSLPTDGTLIDTSDWKTYRNEQYGFEVRYPAEWKFQANENGFKFGTVLDAYNYSQENEAYGYFDARSNPADYGHGAPGPLVREENFILGGVLSIKRIFEGNGFDTATYPLTREVNYQFQRDGNYYYIQFTSASRNSAIWNDFDKMITSIKFL